MPSPPSSLWTVILAAGEGSRLSSLTRALHGEARPKQFAMLDGARSLLQITLDRVAELAPPERTIVVVGRHHARFADEQLGGRGVRVLRQPRNLDTGPGLMLPLSAIRRVDPDAPVAFFPSDHHVPEPAPFLAAVREALAATATHPELVTLLGAAPERPETEYGWITPGPPIRDAGPLRAVAAFVEKPALDVARHLLRQGALWNTFASVGRVSAFWRACEETLPCHAARFDAVLAAEHDLDDPRVLDRLYDAMSPASFSHDVLERASSLAVAEVAGSGWSDLGSPVRVRESLSDADLSALRPEMAALFETAANAAA